MDETEQTREADDNNNDNNNNDEDSENYRDWDDREDWEILDDDRDDDDDDDEGEIIGDFATIEEAIEAAMADAGAEDATHGTTIYADCGYYEIRVEADPDEADPRS